MRHKSGRRHYFLAFAHRVRKRYDTTRGSAEKTVTAFLVFSFGSGEKGQLGNGRTGEHIITGNKTGYDIETSPSASSRYDLWSW
jgi:hypothetical protein